MYYRSDWPEVGLAGPLQENSPRSTSHQQEAAPDWSHESHAAGIGLRWSASQDRFESNLYNIPVWHLRLEVEPIDGAALADPAGSGLSAALAADLERVLESRVWSPAYVCSTVLKAEPLYQALADSGFTEIEERCVYRTPMQEFAARPWPTVDDSVAIRSLADFPEDRHAAIREQILDVSFDAFSSAGHSRHFTDPFLYERRPGLAYITAAMVLNFERLGPSAFLVAIEKKSGLVCGFSVVGKKPGLSASMYTQLLSAARPTFQGRDIYLRVTRRLAEMLPADATLLNVTHASNMPMQMAYQRSGRKHLADTTAMRMVRTQ
jgi:hypothetical protein